MALSVATGAFSSGTGAAGTTVAVTGLGFQPKAIIFFWNGRTDTVSAAGRATLYLGRGFATSSTNRTCLCMNSVDAGASSDGATFHHFASCILSVSNAGAIDGRMDLQSMDADGFTLSVAVQMPRSYRVIYIAYGGDDITNATCGQTTIPLTATTQDVTTPGFQPDAIFTFGSRLTGGSGTGSTSNAVTFFGAASSSAAARQAVLAEGQDDGSATMDTGAYAKTGEVLACQNISNPLAFEYRASLNAFLSNGFQMSFSAVNGAASYYHWLCIKGGSWFVTSSTTATNTTPFSVTGFGHQPLGIIVASASRAESAAGTGTGNLQGSVGVATAAANQVALFERDNNLTANAEVSTGIDVDCVYGNLDSTGAVQGAMDLSSLDSDGATFVMSDADPSGSFFFIASAASAAAPPATEAGYMTPMRGLWGA